MISSQRKAKVNWHCRRGMLELDVILGGFSKDHLEQLTEQQLSFFEQLLDRPDPDIYAWLMGYEQPEEKELADIVAFIRSNDHLPFIT
jgi:antitoxin CptB